MSAKMSTHRTPHSAKTCTVVVVTSAANPWLKGDPDLQGLAYALKLYAEKRGGKCIVKCVKGTMTVAILGLAPNTIAELLAAWGESIRKQGQAVQFTQRDGVPAPSGQPGKSAPLPGTLISERLSKKFLSSLPDDCYVISNCLSGAPPRPVFAERLGGIRTRAELWKRAVDAGAVGRLCKFVWTEEEFNREWSKAG